MPQSVLDAIKMGMWDFEPKPSDEDEYDATVAMPGSDEKLAILARRVAAGLPLWHSDDRISYDEEEE